jgi:3-hydroxybutyryl-CoA dehydrogenase
MMERAVVVGTGLMAPGIAAAVARAGLEVAVTGRSEDRAREAGARAAEPVASGPLAAETFADADLVVETVIEDANVKSELFGLIEPWCRDDAILATNTSSLPLRSLAGALKRPERFAGLHFLNPADRTAVVEVVKGDSTAPEVVAALDELAIRMGKTPVDVRRDVPGFVWNRLQAALLRECVHVLEEGIADIASIDAAISDGLAPRWMATGPLATADMGGTHVFRRVAEQLFPELSCDHAVRGQLGEGRPFYHWTEEAREQIAALREETLAAGAEVARRRREVMDRLS